MISSFYVMLPMNKLTHKEEDIRVENRLIWLYLSRN